MRIIGRIALILGILLILCSLGTLVFMHISTDRAEQQTEDIVTQLKKLLPDEVIGSEDSYSSMEMPSLCIDGEDIIALLEFPEAGVELPISNEWDKNTLISLPQRFSGTVYDGSLIVGGYDRDGQFDCLEILDIENTVTVTDMTGARFYYTVKSIERKDSADRAELTDSAYDLTLFVRDSSSMEYIIVRCGQ